MIQRNISSLVKVNNDLFSRPSEKRTLEWNSQRVTLSATNLYFQCQENLSLKHICQGLQAFCSEIVPAMLVLHITVLCPAHLPPCWHLEHPILLHLV